MTVRIRLLKEKENYRIIVISGKGKILEQIGYYTPKGIWSFAKIEKDRLTYWLQCGGSCTKRVLKIIGKI